MKRQEIVDEARRFVALRTHWARMGRTERQMDCYGLVLAVANKFGIKFNDVERYDLYPDGARLMQQASEYCLQVHPPLKPGMIIVFQVDGKEQHLGIYAIDQFGRPSIIHCSANRKRAFEEPYIGNMDKHFRAAFEFPGVED